MPVRKFRSVEDMPERIWLDVDDPQLWSRIADLWALSARLCPRHLPPGVHKNRSIEEANRRRLAWESIEPA